MISAFVLINYHYHYHYHLKENIEHYLLITSIHFNKVEMIKWFFALLAIHLVKYQYA